MENLARQCVWCPKIDNDIETKVKSCSICAVLVVDPPPCLSSMGIAS